MVLLDKAKRTEEAQFYIRQTIENNWSRAIFTLQKPEFASKMNFYLSAVDDLLKTTENQPSIGLFSGPPPPLCRRTAPP